MDFSEQPPSKQWAALKFRGERVAEVWFKPEGEPLALTFRIAQESFQLPGMGSRLSIETLLKAVAIAPEDVDSWSDGDVSHSSMDGSNPELRNPLPQPPPDVPCMTIHVRLKPTQAVAGEGGALDPALAKWQDLQARWKAILGLEATMDTLRISMEALQGELEASAKKGLTADEKLNALSADIVQWNKAKSRVHYAMPKAREFTHRAIWALGIPERKALDEFFKNHTGPDVPMAEMNQVLEQLENLQKDRQVLAGQGATVYQECRRIAADVQATLRTLLNNGAARATQKKRAAGAKGKFF